MREAQRAHLNLIGCVASKLYAGPEEYRTGMKTQETGPAIEVFR